MHRIHYPPNRGYQWDKMFICFEVNRISRGMLVGRRPPGSPSAVHMTAGYHTSARYRPNCSNLCECFPLQSKLSPDADVTPGFFISPERFFSPIFQLFDLDSQTNTRILKGIRSCYCLKMLHCMLVLVPGFAKEEQKMQDFQDHVLRTNLPSSIQTTGATAPYPHACLAYIFIHSLQSSK